MKQLRIFENDSVYDANKDSLVEPWVALAGKKVRYVNMMMIVNTISKCILDMGIDKPGGTRGGYFTVDNNTISFHPAITGDEGTGVVAMAVFIKSVSPIIKEKITVGGNDVEKDYLVYTEDWSKNDMADSVLEQYPDILKFDLNMACIELGGFIVNEIISSESSKIKIDDEEYIIKITHD